MEKKPKLTKEQKEQIKKQEALQKKQQAHLKVAEMLEGDFFQIAKKKGANFGEYGLAAQFIARRVEQIKEKAQDKKL